MAKSISQDILYLRNRILDSALFAYAVFSVLIISFVGYRQLFLEGVNVTFALQVFGVLSLITLSIFRKRVDFTIKIYLLSAISLILLIPGMMQYGFLASAKVLIIIFPAIAAFLKPYKDAFIILGVYIVIYFLIGFLYSREIFEYTVNPELYVKNPKVWIADGVTIFLSAFALMFLGHYYNSVIVDNFRKIEDQNISLEQEEVKFRLLYENSFDGIFLIAKDKVFDCNQSGVEMFGFPKEELKKVNIGSLFPEKQSDGMNSTVKAWRILQNVERGVRQNVDWTFINNKGDLFDASVSLSHVDFGDKSYIQAVLRDITEKKKLDLQLEQYRNNLEEEVEDRTQELLSANADLKLTNEELKLKTEIIEKKNKELHQTMQELKDAQEKLVLSEKMASLGILTAGVAHEINNPLNYIIGAYEGMKVYLDQNNIERDDRINLILESIESGVEKAKGIVEGLSEFSRTNESLDEICDLEAVINNSLVILHNQYKDRIGIEKEYSHHEAKVLGNSGKLHQVFFNLIMNAIQAIEGKGIISISTAMINEGIELVVEDSGPGIAPEIINRITDPFFTTKEPGKGTGLGLSICMAIVNEHKGSMKFESEPGRGTRVKVWLPLIK